MLSYQQSYFNPCVELTRELWERVTSDPSLQENVHKCTEIYEQLGKGAAYDAQKKKLPLVMFCCTFDPNNGAKGKQPLNTWRCQSAVNINGLFMYDADELREKHNTTPKELFDKIPQWLFDGKECPRILYAGMTPSGDGLRIVATCDVEKGNLADHQQWLGTLLGVPCDKSVKDASRGSFMVSKDYVYYLSDELFNYNNELYYERYNNCYRSGNTAALNSTNSSTVPVSGVAGRPAAAKNEVAAKASDNDGRVDGSGDGRSSDLDEAYHGVAMQKIMDVYLARNPDYAQGDRHAHLLKMAGRLRYIVDNSAAKLKALVRLAPYVQDWEAAEHNSKEIDDICDTAVQQKFYMSKPKVVQDVLARAGVRPMKNEEEKKDNYLFQLQKFFATQLNDNLPEPYKTCMISLDPLNVTPCIYAAGTMFCTLMTRLHYMHYTGEDQRMNPQAVVIGPPASGKGFAEKLNEIIMAPMKQADQLARDTEKKYKKDSRAFEDGGVKMKGQAPVRPELPILYLPTNTSNSVFFRRTENAMEEQENGDMLPLHLYMFDSELASANKRNGGADWIGKRDMELKAFHNEETGVDYANKDSVNALMRIYWNSVTTGTKVALAQKFTLANINDGLCTRIAIAPMVEDHFKMIRRTDALTLVNRRSRLMSWAFEMQKLSGELPIEKLVDYTYDLCYRAAEDAEKNEDLVLDLLRCRAVFYAQWFTVPIIVTRAIEERRALAESNKPGADLPSVLDLCRVTDDDLKFSEVMFNSVIAWQDAYFGQMLQDSWENADKAFVPRVRRSKNADGFAALPQEFKNADVQRCLDISGHAASNQIIRWLSAGFIEKKQKNNYRKLVDFIIM